MTQLAEQRNRTDLKAAARDNLWLHFSPHPQTNDELPMIVRGEGAYIYDDKGRKYLDGLAGLFTVQVGHGRTELADVMARQGSELAFFPLWSFANKPATELAERLAQLAPPGLNKVFFTNSGSESVESAWKLAKQYFRLTGRPQKHKVISRSTAYHGTTHGALSITGIADLKVDFEPLVPSTHRVPNTNFYRAAQHAKRPGCVWAVGCQRNRGHHPGRRPGNHCRRVPGAGAERRRLLSAAAGLLPAGARNLRPVRRPAGQR